MSRKDCRRATIAPADREIIADGASALSALSPRWSLRTTTNEFLDGEPRHDETPFGRYRLEAPFKVVEGSAS